jgi:hypothetical protein
MRLVARDVEVVQGQREVDGVDVLERGRQERGPAREDEDRGGGEQRRAAAARAQPLRK